MNIKIINYGTGNLNSVSKALEVAAAEINKKINIKISNKPKDILDSDRIILPGQGSFRQCALGVKNIPGLWDSLNEFVLVKKNQFLEFVLVCNFFQIKDLKKRLPKVLAGLKAQ
jgi:glutamine amidotransferase